MLALKNINEMMNQELFDSVWKFEMTVQVFKICEKGEMFTIYI